MSVMLDFTALTDGVRDGDGGAAPPNDDETGADGGAAPPDEEERDAMTSSSEGR